MFHSNPRGHATSSSSIAPLLAICSIGSAVEFCWAAGEAVLVPYLERHGVRKWVVSTIYLANPTLGLWAQPRLGAWSDRINRRVPFVVALSSTAQLGIATLVTAIPLTKALGFDEADESVSPAAIAVAFLGFGAADVCFDCLLVPGRALLHDLDLASSSDELFTGFQLGGRLLALLVGSSKWKVGNSVDAHFNACFAASAAFLTGSAVAVLVFVDDRGSTYSIPADIDRPTGKQRLVQSSSPSTPKMSNHNGVGVDTDIITPKENAPALSLRRTPGATALLCAIQAAGWVGVCAQSFFWTSYRGEGAGCVDLALQGVVGMVTAAFLPFANERFGASTVWCGSELLFHLLMTSVGLMSNSIESSIPRVVSALTGINYAVHATNGIIVATDVISDPSRRARTIAMVNNALPAGQLITALTGGVIAQYFGGGFQSVFVCYGLLGALATSAAWAVSSRQGLFDKS